uniref:Uncharacterized protein n=1 Tax=Opuntia streptacantha TaxID=393608 RepID=A0A7C9CYS5_OPUST
MTYTRCGTLVKVEIELLAIHEHTSYVIDHSHFDEGSVRYSKRNCWSPTVLPQEPVYVNGKFLQEKRSLSRYHTCISYHVSHSNLSCFCQLLDFFQLSRPY